MKCPVCAVVLPDDADYCFSCRSLLERIDTPAVDGDASPSEHSTPSNVSANQISDDVQWSAGSIGTSLLASASDLPEQPPQLIFPNLPPEIDLEIEREDEKPWWRCLTTRQQVMLIVAALVLSIVSWLCYVKPWQAPRQQYEQVEPLPLEVEEYYPAPPPENVDATALNVILQGPATDSGALTAHGAGE